MKKVLPPVLLATSIGFIALLRSFWPLSVFMRPPLTFLGVIPILMGLALISAALFQFRKIGATIKPFRKPRALVKEGICRYSRNPMYLGEILILAGAWILTGAISPLIAVAAFALIADRWFVRKEEAVLSEIFGQEYRDYCRKTRRWI